MEDQDPVVQPVENTPKKTKLSGDARTFVISLLTALIVVLLYHGIAMAICCFKGGCPKQTQNCSFASGEMCPGRPKFEPPQEWKHHHRHPGRKHFRRQHQMTPENNAGEAQENK